MYRWYLPFSAGNFAPGSLEIQSRNELTCLLNSPLLSDGSTQSVTLPVVDCVLTLACVRPYSPRSTAKGDAAAHHSRLRQINGFVM